METDSARLLVECGLFQGYKKLRLRNWARLPVDPATLDAVVLTHAHLDHSGYLPRLCKLGFRGRIHATPATRDLLEILLPDSGYLQEEDAHRANRYGYTRHHPAQPLYTRADAEACLPQVTTQPFGRDFAPAPGITARFNPAGHILGAASVHLDLEGTRLTFSGDVGRPHDPLMNPPAPLGPTDYLVVESTYGDRRHPDENVEETLARIVNETVARGGVVLVPTFAVGRAQHLLHLLGGLRDAGRIPQIPIYLDSPMAISATEVFYRHPGEHRLSEEACQRLRHIAQCSLTADDSKALTRSSTPKVILSASGMATGGRVLHHLGRFLPESQHTVLFVGYQAGGTRGRALLTGTEELKIHGQYVRVRAHVVQLQGLSAHADAHELTDWLAQTPLAPRRVFVTHGEPAASDALRRRLRDVLGWNTVVPDDGSIWQLDPEAD